MPELEAIANRNGIAVNPVGLGEALKYLRELGLVKQKAWHFSFEKVTATMTEKGGVNVFTLSNRKKKPEPQKREPKPEPPPHSGRKWDDSEVLAVFPFGEKNALPLAQIAKRAESELSMPRSVFSTYRFNLLTVKLVHQSSDGKYFKQ